MGEFSVININLNEEPPKDDQGEDSDQGDDNEIMNEVGGHKVIQLNNKFIPNGFFPLEKIFDQNDIPTRNETMMAFKLMDKNVEEYDLSMKENPHGKTF